MTSYFAPYPLECARITSSVNVAIPSAIFTPVTFDTVRFDTDSMFSLANPTRLTVRTAGKYLLGGTLQYTAVGGGAQRAAGISINGIAGIAYNYLAVIGADIITVATIWNAIVGDYFTLDAYQDSGAPNNVLSAAQYTPEFWAHRLS